MSRVGAVLLLAALSLLSPIVHAEELPTPTTVDALIAMLDTTHEPTARLARDLGMLEGRAALSPAAREAWERRARARAVQVAAADAQAAPPWRSRWLEIRQAQWREDVSYVEALVDNLRRNLAGDDVLTNDLRSFLGREDAARTLHRVLVRPRHRPATLQAVLARCLAADDAGRPVVPRALAARAAKVLATDREVAGALDRLRAILPEIRPRLELWAHAWLAWGDLPEEQALAVLLHAAGGWTGDPGAVVHELATWAARGDPGELRGRLRSGPHLGDLRETARIARAYAARLADDSELDPWRELLRSPRALLLSPGGRLERSKPVDLLLNGTGFGRALAMGSEGTVRVNPHARWDLDRILVALRIAAAEVSGVPPAEDPLRELASWGAKAERVEPLRAWIDDHLVWTFGDLRVREGVELDVPSLDPCTRVVLDPVALDYQAESLDLLRSSIFYNPRTGYGHYAYVTAFDDHHTARLFGTFGWNAKVCKDLADFKNRIRARKEQLQQLAKTHDKLVIHMSGVPPWLSSWEGTGTFEAGGWEDKQAHPPKDVAVWKEMIRELALVFREVEGVERYYEFWNEPDLKYWQGSLADFLALYEATVTTIREVDPAGKVGGPAVNQWDGRIHKKTGSDVLVHELIRYAAKKELPLDFVSWHHFGRPVSAIAEAKASYAAELAKHGFDSDATEYLVTEWSAPGRGTPFGSTAFADAMLGFFHAEVDAQTASCWEEFHAKPNPKGFAPWGLMTQQGDRHGTWYVHRFFDRLARDSRGVAVERREDGTVLVVSKKADGVYDLLVWRTGIHPSLRAALERLDEAKIDRQQRRWFGTTDRFERALRERAPVPVRWKDAFLAACDAYASADTGPERLVLEIAGATEIDVVFAESVRTEHAVKDVAVLDNVLTCPLQRYEVLRLTIRVE